MRIIDADALNAVIVHRHDFFRGCTAAPEKARRDELLQVMCDINDQPTVDAIPVEWIEWRIAHAEREGFGAVVSMLRTVRDWWNDQQDIWQQEQEADNA